MLKQISDMSLFMRLDESAQEFDSFHVELFRHEHNDDDLLGCHETDDPNNEHLSVSFDELIHWMTFLNRSSGYYCVVVIPEDDRCHPPLIDPEKTCARHSNIVHLKSAVSFVFLFCYFQKSIKLFANIGTPKLVLMTYYSETDVMAYWIAGLVVVVVAVFIVTLCAFRLKRSPKYQPVPPPDQQQDTITDRPVLLFYSRLSSDGLAEKIGRLKQDIRKHVSHQVFLFVYFLFTRLLFITCINRFTTRPMMTNWSTSRASSGSLNISNWPTSASSSSCARRCFAVNNFCWKKEEKETTGEKRTSFVITVLKNCCTILCTTAIDKSLPSSKFDM